MMTFHNTWYNWWWTETILENISNFLSLIHLTEQFLEILFATDSYYVVHPRLVLNVVSFHPSLPSIVTTGVPALAFPMSLTEQFVSLQFIGLKKQNQGGNHRHITQVPLPYMRKQCYANQAITKAHQEAWGQLQKNGKNPGVYSRS